MSDCNDSPSLRVPPEEGDRKLYWGKYRGKVLDNIDPYMIGRLLVEVPAIPGGLGAFAMPCVPYAGFQVGFYAMPPIGANVWVEFEGGDPSYPIWVGCFWDEGEVPLEAVPPMKVFKTEFITMVLNDLPEAGGFLLSCIPPAVDVPLTMTFDSLGIQILAPPGSITMSPEEGINVVYPPSNVELTAPALLVNATEINLAADAALTAEATADMTLTAGGIAELTAGGDLALTGGGAAELSGGLDVSVEAGAAIELTAGLDIAVTAGAAIEITAIGDIAITAAASEITSAGIALTGAVEVTGDCLVDGQQVLVI